MMGAVYAGWMGVDVGRNGSDDEQRGRREMSRGDGRVYIEGGRVSFCERAGGRLWSGVERKMGYCRDFCLVRIHGEHSSRPCHQPSSDSPSSSLPTLVRLTFVFHRQHRPASSSPSPATPVPCLRYSSKSPSFRSPTKCAHTSCRTALVCVCLFDLFSGLPTLR